MRTDNGMIQSDGDNGGEPELCEECRTALDDCGCQRCGVCEAIQGTCVCVEVCDET